MVAGLVGGREHDEGSEPPFGVLQVSLAGVKTPLQRRALEELGREEGCASLFGSYWVMTASDQLNKRTDTR